MKKRIYEDFKKNYLKDEIIRYLIFIALLIERGIIINYISNYLSYSSLLNYLIRRKINFSDFFVSI